jgi:hypothetical protein
MNEFLIELPDELLHIFPSPDEQRSLQPDNNAKCTPKYDKV